MAPKIMRTLNGFEKKNGLRFRPSPPIRRGIRKFSKPRKFSRFRSFVTAKRYSRICSNRKISSKILKKIRECVRELLKDCKQIASLSNRTSITSKDIRLAERIRGIKPGLSSKLFLSANHRRMIKRNGKGILQCLNSGQTEKAKESVSVPLLESTD